MKSFFQFFIKRPENISKGEFTITHATGIRWFGWGFAESLIPVLLFSYSSSFTEAGILKSIYDIAYFLTTGVLMLYVSRFKATTIIFIGLLLYPFIGLSYFLLGLTGSAIFIFIARLLNGIGYSFDSVGRQLYFRRYTPKEYIATALGYFDTIANGWWILASFLGLVFINFFSISELLLLITPTSLIALFIVYRLSKEEVMPSKTISDQSKVTHLFNRKIFLQKNLRILFSFNFIVASVQSILSFFIPINAYANGAELWMVILIGIVGTIPSTFGFPLGRLFDKKGAHTFTLSILLLALFVLSLVFVNTYIWKIVVLFFSNIIFEFIYLGTEEVTVRVASKETVEQSGSFMKEIVTLGAFIGPVLFGISLDKYGFQESFLTLSFLILVSSTFYFKFFKKVK